MIEIERDIAYFHYRCSANLGLVVLLFGCRRGGAKQYYFYVSRPLWMWVLRWWAKEKMASIAAQGRGK